MNKQTLVERHIEEGIAQGQWKLSDKLPPERELATRLGVSRGTVRSALQALGGRGILESTQGSGTVVRHIPRDLLPTASNKALLQRMEVMVLFMPPLMAHCVGCAAPSHVLHMERLLQDMGLAVRNADMKGFVSIQCEFFAQYVAGTSNGFMVDAVAQVLPGKKFLLRLMQSRHLHHFEPVFAIFARLLNALRHADAESAAQAARSYTAFLLNIVEEASPCTTPGSRIKTP